MGSGFDFTDSALDTAIRAPGIGSGELFNIQFGLKLIW